MKYIIFFLTFIGCFPAAFVVASQKKFMKFLLFLTPLFLLIFDNTAINFASHELYRGTSRGIEVSLVYLVIMTLWLAMVIKHFKMKFWMPGLWSYVLYYLLSIMSLVNASNLLYSSFELWKMLMVLFIFHVVVNYLVKTGDFDSLIYSFAVFVVLNFFFILLYKYGYGEIYARGKFPHKNSMAMFMGLLAPVFLARWVCEKNRKVAWFFGAICGITALSGVLSMSRGFIAELPVACAITLALSIGKTWTAHKIQVLLFIVIVGFLVTLRLLPSIIERFQGDNAGSNNTRLELAICAKNMANDYGFGVGINNWGIMIMDPRYRRDDPRVDQLESDLVTETIYMLVAAECGWHTLVSLLLFFGTFYTLNLLNLKPYAGTRYYYLAAGFTGGFLGVFAQSILEWVLKQQINFIALMLCFAMVSAMTNLKKKLPKPMKKTTKKRSLYEPSALPLN